MVASSTDCRISVRVGLIQTNCPSEYWSMPASKKAAYSDELWNYIKGCFAAFLVGQERPDIILLPELALPRYRIFQLQSMALRLGIIVIAGLDYVLDSKKLEAARALAAMAVGLAVFVAGLMPIYGLLIGQHPYSELFGAPTSVSQNLYHVVFAFVAVGACTAGGYQSRKDWERKKAKRIP